MERRRQFLLPSFLLLLLLLLLNSESGHCQSSTPTPPHSPTPSTTTSTSTSSTSGNGRGTWVDNIASMMENLLGSLTKSPQGRNGSSASVLDLVSKLPGVFQGLGRASPKGSDVTQVLANLFADPSTNSTPAWIEALVKGSNFSQALNLQNISGQILQALSQQGNSGQQLQTLLSQVFPDVAQAISSLSLSPNSSAQDIVSAILKNPSLMSSMSTMGQAMLQSLSGQGGSSLQDALMGALSKQFPVDPTSQCAADLLAVGRALQTHRPDKDMWAMKMVDATGKIPAGILEGYTELFGDFEECSYISHSTEQKHTIEGLFCGMAVKAPDALAQLGAPVIGLHLCLPSSCNEYHRYGLVQPTLKSIGSQYYGQYCYRPRDPSGDSWFTGVVTVFGILGALCVLGTAYGVYLDRKTKRGEAYELGRTPPPTTTTTPPPPPTTTTSNAIYANQAYVPDNLGGDPAKKGGHVLPASSNGNAGDVSGGEKGKLPSVFYTKVFTNGDGGASKLNGSQSQVVSEASSKPKEGLCAKLLLSFSVLRNGRKLLACGQNSGDISCLHGIRVLSITWVILGHAFSQLQQAQANKVATVRMLQYFTYAVFPGALFSVDTFFLLSGCLTAFLFLRAYKKNGLTLSGFFLYFFHRIWRLTPLYALMLFYYAGIFPYTKRGPFENLQGMDSESNCRDYWYYNLLYVNNVIDKKLEKICFGWSWYLSNDMQFSILAPIVLIPWVFRDKMRVVGEILGCLMACAWILVHTVTSGVISYKNDFSIFKNTGEYMDKIYFTPWCRIGPYAVGLLLGFILHKTPRTYKMSKAGVVIGWALAWAVALTLVYVNHDNLRDLMHGIRWNASGMAAYEALSKWVWAVCVGWVIFACYTGYGGFVNTVLSWSAWAPLSRLTYGVYLIHLVVLSTLTGNYKTKIHLDAWTGTDIFLAVTVLSYLVSFIFSLLIEGPTLGLEKAILGKVMRRSRK